MKPYLFFLAVLLIFACKAKNKSSDGAKNKYVQYRIPGDSNIFIKYRDKFSKKDSLKICYYGRLYLNGFNEQDLSVNKIDNIFRLIYIPGSLDTMRPVLFSITQNEIIVKKGIDGDLFPYQDNALLTEQEKFHFDILNRFFPFNDTSRHDKRLIIYLDSLSKKYPQLNDPGYYEYLLSKSASYRGPFKYETLKIPISDKKFESLSALLNKSGYWNLPYEYWCTDMSTDAGGFNLEGKRENQYQYVQAYDCVGDTSLFRKACQEIVKLAKMDDKVKLIWYEN